MRKILSEAEQKSKERFNQILVGIVLIGVMILSTLGYSLSSKDEEEGGSAKKVIYNGFEFTNQNGFWVLDIENLEFAFRNNPNEVKRIDSNVSLLNAYFNQPLYLSSEDGEASSEIYINLNQITLRMQNACLNSSLIQNKSKDSCDENLPIKDCNSNFIIIKESNNTEIIQNQKCVFIQGPKEELLNLTDEFLFKIIGID